MVLEDWAHGLAFEPGEIDRERGVVIEEWRQHRGAGGRNIDVVLPLILGPEYAARLPIGTLESLQAFKSDTLVRYYRDWYRPDLMTVIVVGDIDVDATEKAVRAHFEPLKNPSPERPRKEFVIPAAPKPLINVFADPEVTSTSLAITRLRTLHKPQTVIEERDWLLEEVLQATMAERLAAKSMQKDPPWVGASAGGDQMSRNERGLMFSAATLEGGAPAAVKQLGIEIERLRRFGITAAELERAKKAMEASMERYYADRNTFESEGKVDELLRVATLGETVPGVEYEYKLSQALLPQVTLDAVNQRIDRWLTSDRTVILLTLPRHGTPTTEAQLVAALDAAAKADIPAPAAEDAQAMLLPTLPTPGRVVKTEVIKPLGVTRWTLSNGARVWVKVTDFKADQIGMTAWAPGGTSLATDEHYIAAVTAQDIQSASGLGAFDVVTLPRVLAGKTVGGGAWVNNFFQGLNGFAAPKDLETLMQLLYLQFTAPRFDPVPFERDVASRKTTLENRLAEPGSQLQDKLIDVLWKHHKRHISWTPETLAGPTGMDLSQSAAFFKARFANAGHFDFVFVGAIDPAKLQPLVEQYLASLPSSDRKETWRDIGARTVDGVHKEVVKAGIEAKAEVKMVFTAPFKPTWEHRNAAYAMADILGVKLREVLREDKGGTYGANVWADPEEIPTGTIQVTIDFQCDPKRVPELEAETMKIVESMRKTPVDAHYVNDEKAKNHRARETDRKTNSFWIGQLSGALQRNEDPLKILDYDKRVDSLTPEVIRDAARDWLPANRYVEVTLLPATP